MDASPTRPLQHNLDIDDHSLTASVSVRFYDFGVVFALQIPADDLDWPAFTARMNAIDRVVGLERASPIWDRLLHRVRAAAGSAFIKPTDSALQKDICMASSASSTAHSSLPNSVTTPA